MIDRLVTDGIRRDGRLDARPRDVNVEDDAGGLLGLARRARLKEWIGFVVLHPEVWMSMIVQDARYLATSDVVVFEPGSGPARHQVVRRGSTVALPRVLFPSHAGVSRPGYEVAYDFGADPDGPHGVRVDVTASGGGPGVAADLELDGSGSPPPLSVSAPLPGSCGGRGTMFTHKRIYRVSGTVRVGDREHRLDPERDTAILDEHRSGLPYRTRWVWGTFAAVADGALVGANFAHRLKIPGSEEESCLWTPGAAEPLADVDFDHDPADRLGPWRIRSRDRRLDVTFEPVNREDVVRNLGAVAIDYFMMQGRYTGTIVGLDRTHRIDGAHGVCERMHARL